MKDDDDLFLALVVGTLKKKRRQQAVGPSYKSKEAWNLLPSIVKDDLMKYGEKFREYLRLTRELFDQVHHLFVLLGAVYTGESPEY